MSLFSLEPEPEPLLSSAVLDYLLNDLTGSSFHIFIFDLILDTSTTRYCERESLDSDETGYYTGDRDRRVVT
jgi:hypothetical protein